MNSAKKRLIYSLIIPTLLLIIISLVRLTEDILDIDLYFLGIYPLTLQGMPGIITSVFIHSGWDHLIANSIPLFLLSWCLFYFYAKTAYYVFPTLWILSGFVTWLIGRDSWCIGASGLIYALVTYIFFSGIFTKDRKLIGVSLIVIFLYGSMSWNMTPIAMIYDKTTSWEGHLSGAISGLILAFLYRKNTPSYDPTIDNTIDNDDDELTKSGIWAVNEEENENELNSGDCHEAGMQHNGDK